MAKKITVKTDNELKEKMIKPVDIQTAPTEDDDTMMPPPQTKVYKKMLRCSPLFMGLLNDCLGQLPYNYVLTNKNGNSIRLVDFFKFIETKKDKIEIEEMNDFIGYIAGLPFKYARPIMEIIENKEKQPQLWSLVEC